MGENTRFHYASTRDLTREEWEEVERDLLIQTSKRIKEQMKKDIEEGRGDIYKFRCKNGVVDLAEGLR